MGGGLRALLVDARAAAPSLRFETHDPAALLASQSILSAFEAGKGARMIAPEARALRLAAHVVKREALGAALSVGPESIAFEEPLDRPRLLPPHDMLHVSLSHTKGAVALAFGPRRIGVDVETLGRSKDPVAMAQRFFGAGEAEKISESPFEFVWRWCAKEALKKAADVDLFAALALPMPLDIDPQHGFSAHGARFKVWCVGDTHVCAVAEMTA